MSEYLDSPERTLQRVTPKNKPRISLAGLIFGAIVCIGSFGAGIGINYRLDAPVSIKKINLNGDEREDAKITTRRGEVFYFVQNKDGSYRPASLFEMNQFEKEGRIKYSIDNKVQLR